MSKNDSNIDNVTKPAIKKSLFGRILKWGLILFILLILLLGGVFIFIQTDTFDNLALNFILDKLNANLAEKDSKIFAESLEGNIFTGLTLKKGEIIVKGDTMVKFTSLSVSYNILDFLKNKITVTNLILDKPEIFLTQIRDRNDSLKWNLSYFLESEEKEEDTVKSEFDWDITAGNLEIHDGAFRILKDKGNNYYGRNFIMPKLDTFNLDKFEVNNFNLKLNGEYFKEEKHIRISKIGFKTNSDFNVQELNLEAKLNEKDTLIEIKNFNLHTDRTNLELKEILARGVNPTENFEYDKLENKFVRIDMAANQFNFKDLTFFIPEINFLDSTVSLELTAEGPYGNLNIDNLKLKTPNSHYTFAGNVKNLDEPSKLYFDVRGSDILIDPRDTKINLPGLPIPDYSYLGVVTIPYATYKGEPQRFGSDFDVRTTAGNAHGEVYFDFTQSEARYKADITASNLNVGKIIKDKSLESEINGDFNVDARGFDYRTMSGKLNYDLRRTRFYGQNISKSSGHLDFNRGNVGVDADFSSDALQTKLTGRVNISNIKNISYDLRGTVNNLNVAAFSKDNSQTSNLNFSFNINGRGFDPNNITGNFKIDMNPSSFAEYKIPAAPLEVEIDQNGNIKKVSLKSEFIDMTANGVIDIRALGDIINQNIEKLESGLADKLNTDDTARLVIKKVFQTECRNINFHYTLNIKNLDPLYSFTGNDTIKFRGNLSGNLSDSCGIFAFNADGIIHELELKDSAFVTDSALVNLAIRNELNAPSLTKLDASLIFRANKIIAANQTIDTTLLKFTYRNDTNHLMLLTEIDTTVRIFAQLGLRDSGMIYFDSLSLRYKDILATNNKELIIKAGIRDSNIELNFRQFTINSLDQRLNIQGKFSTVDSSNLKLFASNIDLGYFQRRYFSDIDTSNIISGRIRYFDVVYKGVPSDPEVNMSANSEILKIGSTKIGALGASVKYKDVEISPNIVFYNERNTGKFSITGSIPSYTIPYTNFPHRTIEDSIRLMAVMKDKSAFLDITADTFQLRVFQQLLPYTENLRGILNGKIHVAGTADKPELTGNMDITKGKVSVTLTKMTYSFEAGLSTKDENLLIENSKLFVEDDKTRFISTTGYINFTNFALNEINLKMTGDVKAFDKENGNTELGISGDLWVGSGKPALNLKGNSDKMVLSGNLILVKGNVTFNPFVQEAYNLYSDDFIYGLIVDSLKSDSTKKVGTIMQSNDSVVVISGKNLNPFEKIIYTLQNQDYTVKAKQKSGKFFYDVRVSTSGNVFLRFIVNEKSQQEFFGEIRTEDLNIYNYVGYQMQGRGTITLGESYYKFFRKFDASGKVVFWGPITNPELDINAVYTGYSTMSTHNNVNQVEDVTIDMHVTGDAKNPELVISLNRNGVTETGSNASSDAISFLLFGKFKDQLSFGESSSFGASLGASLLSNIVSNSIEEVFPFLINTTVNYVDNQSGNVAQNTDIQLTAAVGDAIIKVGGQIFKGIANTDIVIDYPLNKIFSMSSLSNNLILRLEKIYDPFGDPNNVTNTSGTKTGAVIYYKIKF